MCLNFLDVLPRPVTRAASSPWKTCWTLFKTIANSLKMWAPLRKLSAPLESQAGYGPGSTTSAQFLQSFCGRSLTFRPQNMCYCTRLHKLINAT